MSEEKKNLENGSLYIEINRKGAELARIYDKCRKQEILWEADPKIWGRHSPVLFPFVGKSYENQYRLDGTIYPMGQHGFARDMDFELMSETEKEVWYTLSDTEETREKYPFHFRLDIGYRLEGNTVRVMWKVENPSDRELYFMIGAHPGFRTPEGKTIYDFTFDFQQGGAFHYQAPNGEGYADKEKEGVLHTEDGKVPLTPGFFKDTLTYIFDRGQIEKIGLLLDGKPFVTMECKGFPYMALWTEEDTHPFVCLEPWYGRCAEKGFSGDLREREGLLTLKGKESFQAEYTIRVEAAE